MGAEDGKTELNHNKHSLDKWKIMQTKRFLLQCNLYFEFRLKLQITVICIELQITGLMKSNFVTNYNL